MKPVYHAKSFGAGAGKVKIRYHNGTSPVTGYIVKQIGVRRYRVTTDGTTTYDVVLAENTTLAQTLTAGFATIQVTPFGGGTENVHLLQGYKCYTTQGNQISWMLTGAAKTGEGNIEVN